VLRSSISPTILLAGCKCADVASGLLDIKRLGELLSRVRARIVHTEPGRVSPLSVPVLLEIGRETVYGEASDTLLAEAADELIKEAMS
jgi:ATP-dependent Lhr-like helicase